MKVLPCGDAAVLVEFDGLDQVHAAYDQLREMAIEGVLDLVPAARTLLVTIDPRAADADELARRLEAVSLEPRGERGTADARVVEVPVTYDGADLDEVGRLTGLGRDGVVAAHTGQRWTVAFGGFAPGFAYLVGEDDRLRVPRRSEPRGQVPAGAVGLADDLSGIYPRPSPGGWQLIGRTDLQVWDPRRDPPTLLEPGTHVRFQAVR
ncbi:MAG: 5-oxoprolinase subunit PxpB [Nitriliruptor sp.]